MLADARVVYVILYVRNLARSKQYYEKVLGLRCIEQDDGALKYDAGQVIVCLNRAADYGIELPKSRDNSTDIVFLVDDIGVYRSAMEKRGVEFTPTVKYEIGQIADFYDPDGHWFTLYEPSETAMGWPSGPKLNAMQRLQPKRSSLVASAAEDERSQQLGLDGVSVIYLFLFVLDAQLSCEFYGQQLGLTVLEGGQCSQTQSGNDDDVVKYEVGSMMLATHHTTGTSFTEDVKYDLSEHSSPPRDVDPSRTHGAAIVFHVHEIAEVAAEMAKKGVNIESPRHSAIGGIAKFVDPSNHLFYLYEPSQDALRLPSGTKLKEILATPIAACLPTTTIA